MSVVQEARAALRRRQQDQSAESETCGLEAAVSTVIRDPSINDVSLYDRLARKVGFGDMPAKRKALFSRLVKLHRVHGERVELAIAEAWASSCGARHRDRYFCVAVCRKLAEAGMVGGEGEGGGSDVI